MDRFENLEKANDILKRIRTLFPLAGFRKLTLDEIKGLGLDKRFDWASFEVEWLGHTTVFGIWPVQPASP